MINMPCQNYVCCAVFIHVSSKVIIKLDDVLSVALKIWLVKKKKSIACLRMQLDWFYMWRITLQFTAQYNKDDKRLNNFYPRWLISEEIIAQRSKHEKDNKH